MVYPWYEVEHAGSHPSRGYAMIFDLRTDDLHPGKVPEYAAAVRDLALPAVQRHGIRLAGWYYTEIGTLNRVVHIWAFRDGEHLATARAQLRQDLSWTGRFIPRVLPLIAAQQSQLCEAADFSPAPPPASDPGAAGEPGASGTPARDALHDLRTYDLHPGKLGEYRAAVRELAWPIRERHGVRLAGWYSFETGTLDRVVHIWAYRDWAQLTEAKARFRADPDWTQRYLPRALPLIAAQHSQIVYASDFSPRPAPA